MKILIAFSIVTLVLALGGALWNAQRDGGTGADGVVTCAELADEAVSASADQDVQLLKVREVEVDLDKQDTGWEKPTGADDVVILRCQGTGVWSDGTTSGLRLEATVDADGDAFFFYTPTA